MRKPMRNLAAIGRLGMTAVLVAGLVMAANKGPDAGGYTASDSVVYSFIDPFGSGGAPSVLSGSEFGGTVLTLPFTFQFYGTGYTKVCVSTNGIAYFVTSQNQTFCGGTAQLGDFANTDLTGTATPGDMPAIAPFWSNLTFAQDGAGAVYYQTLGTSPNRQFVVEWYNAFTGSPSSAVVFEAVLYEGSNNILFQYQTVNLGANVASNGGRATVGIRNAGGNTNGQQLQWSYNSAVLANSYAILFTAPSSTLTSVNTIDTAPSGISVTIDGVATATPAIVRWAPGSGHTLSVTTPQTNGGTQTTLNHWSPNNETTAQISLNALASGISYIANFDTKYKLTTSANPSSEGTVNGNGTFVTAGQSITVTATANAGFKLINYSGDLTGSTNPAQVLMDRPKNIVANFGVSYVCSASGGTSATVADVQAFVNETLGKASAVNDTNGDGVVNVVDVQIVINAVLSLGCTG